MDGKSIPLFTLRGFQVKIHLTWLIIFALLTWTLAVGYFPSAFENQAASTYWAMGIAGALGLFVSIILHEFGHSVVARRFGLPIKGITLFIFGGVAEMEEEPPTARAELAMAVAGPAVSVVLVGVFYLIYLLGLRVGWPVPVTGVVRYLALINGILVVFNMVPAFPLDGGRVLRSILWQRKKNLGKATRVAAGMGSGFGVVLIVLGVATFLMGNFIGGVWWFLIGIFLRNASQMSYRQLQIRRALEGEPTRRFMKTDPVTVPPQIPIRELVEEYIYIHQFDMFPVVRDGEVLGCIGPRQVKSYPREEWDQHSVQEALQKCTGQNTVSPDTDAVQVLSLMKRSGNSRLLVLENGRLAGVIALKDLLSFLALKLDLEGDENENPKAIQNIHG